MQELKADALRPLYPYVDEEIWQASVFFLHRSV